METEKVSNKRLYTCFNCSWFRDVVISEARQRMWLMHPIYGKASVITIANIDIVEHECRDYEALLLRLGRK